MITMVTIYLCVRLNVLVLSYNLVYESTRVEVTKKALRVCLAGDDAYKTWD